MENRKKNVVVFVVFENPRVYNKRVNVIRDRRKKYTLLSEEQNMFTTFKEMEAYVLVQNMKKRIALANAHD